MWVRPAFLGLGFSGTQLLYIPPIFRGKKSKRHSCYHHIPQARTSSHFICNEEKHGMWVHTMCFWVLFGIEAKRFMYISTSTRRKFFKMNNCKNNRLRLRLELNELPLYSHSLLLTTLSAGAPTPLGFAFSGTQPV